MECSRRLLVLTIWILFLLWLATPSPTAIVLERERETLQFPVQTPFDFNTAADARPNLDLKNAVETCRRCLWRGLLTTTQLLDDGGTFVFTGDIGDMWLRDSAAQIHPYIPLVSESAHLRRVVSGLIKRHAFYIRHDPWANSFRADAFYSFSEKEKKLGRHDFVSTWNYELDSGCYFLRMLHRFWTHSSGHPDSLALLRSREVQDAVEILIELWRAEQHHEEDRVPTGPLFDCKNCRKPYRYKELPRNGKGSRVAYTGMTWTGFRPSDDATVYGYLVPANMFAVASLRSVVEMAKELWKRPDVAADAGALMAEIEHGIRKHGIVRYGGKRVYAYEVDGLGHVNMMDDANVPSLMSIPYLGYDYDPEVYRNTRAFILSADNPTFAASRANRITGYGSPHARRSIPHNVWPMALIMQGLTSPDLEEKLRLVDMLLRSTAGTGWMHESFDPNNPSIFTRSWFCWADALFAELVLSISPACLAKPWPEA